MSGEQIVPGLDQMVPNTEHSRSRTEEEIFPEIDKSWLTLHLQHQIDLNDPNCRIMGYEGLMRLDKEKAKTLFDKHPNFNFNPYNFAVWHERQGPIKARELDDTILKLGIRILRQIAEPGNEHMLGQTVTINQSTINVAQEDYAEHLYKLIEEEGMVEDLGGGFSSLKDIVKHLGIEVTESHTDDLRKKTGTTAKLKEKSIMQRVAESMNKVHINMPNVIFGLDDLMNVPHLLKHTRRDMIKLTEVLKIMKNVQLKVKLDRALMVLMFPEKDAEFEKFNFEGIKNTYPRSIESGTDLMLSIMDFIRDIREINENVYFIAEGIESGKARELQVLRLIGASGSQGYVGSKPVDISECTPEYNRQVSQNIYELLNKPLI